MRIPICLLTACAALALAAGSARADNNKIPDKLKVALEKCTSVEIFSLEPSPRIEGFEGWKILGSLVISDTAALNKINKVLSADVVDGEGEAADFKPRHGLRVTYDSKVYDLVISFENQQAQAYIGQTKETIPLTKAAQPLFDQILMDAKVPLGQRDRVGIIKEIPKKVEDPLPGFPDIKYSAKVLEVVGRADKPLLKIIKTDYDQDKKQITWLVEAQNDITYEDYIAIRNAWQNGFGRDDKGPAAHFFGKDKVKVYKRDLKEVGFLRDAKKGDCIRLILDTGDGFPEATSMEIRRP